MLEKLEVDPRDLKDSSTRSRWSVMEAQTPDRSSRSADLARTTAAVDDLEACNDVAGEEAVGGGNLDDSHWAADTVIAGKLDADTRGLNHSVDLPSRGRRLSGRWAEEEMRWCL